MAVARGMFAGLVLATGLWVSTVQAQSLPKIEEFYFDTDAAAAPVVVIAPDSANLLDQLMKQRERGRKVVEATTQLAGLAMSQGRHDLGRTLYSEAMGASTTSSTLGRSVRWNYAWDLYRTGDAEAALREWAGAHATLRSNPGWIPPTYALALWTLGRRDEAVQWFAAAVRTEPQLWSNPDNFARLLPDWREEERATLQQVHQAWVQNPPRWP